MASDNSTNILHQTAANHTAISSEALLRENNVLRDFIENLAVPLHWVGPDGTILWANQAELAFLGYSPDEYIGHNIADFHVHRAVIDDILCRLMNNETLHGYEAVVLCKDGTHRVVAISSSVYREDGRFIHSRCVSLDMSDKSKAIETQSRLASIVESSGDAVISKDLNGIILSWNRGAESIFGYTAGETVGKHISMLAVPERADEIPNILDRIRHGEKIDHYLTKRRAKDGRVLDISLTVSPVVNVEGIIIGASKVARDITGQFRLSEVQERLAAIVESSDDAIISKDLSGMIESWNGGAQRLFGYTAEEMVGKHISVLAPAERVDEIPNLLERIANGERVIHYETKRRTKDGRILDISLTVSPVRNGQGKIIGASKVARDITDRKAHEVALLKSNQALTQANSDLQQFAYSASHDLQEPLRTVTTYSEMLQRKFAGKLGADGDEFIRYTVQGALRMEQLLADLRDYTQASLAGEDPASELDANVSFNKAMENLGAAVEESGAWITHSELPTVHLHEFQLEHLFQNLIGNAIRYRSAKPPQVHVSAKRVDSDWLFSVKDNGIGIDPRYREQIFGIFKRLHSLGEHPGTGMGLAICQKIIDRTGGRIWVESEPGAGSTFFFTVPIHPN